MIRLHPWGVALPAVLDVLLDAGHPPDPLKLGLQQGVLVLENGKVFLYSSNPQTELDTFGIFELFTQKK